MSSFSSEISIGIFKSLIMWMQARANMLWFYWIVSDAVRSPIHKSSTEGCKSPNCTLVLQRWQRRNLRAHWIGSQQRNLKSFDYLPWLLKPTDRKHLPKVHVNLWDLGFFSPYILLGRVHFDRYFSEFHFFLSHFTGIMVALSAPF